MSAPIVYHDLYSRLADSLTPEERSQVEAVIGSIDISSGEPKSPHPIRSADQDSAILATPDIWLFFRPEDGELHILGIMTQEFIDQLNRARQTNNGSTEPVESAKKPKPTRKPTYSRKPETTA